MVVEGVELQHAMPARIVTAEHLRSAQLSMARRGVPPRACQELPLPASSGRVLARDLDIADTNGCQQTLPTGTRLDWYLLPLLAASGHASVPVFAPVRCGIMTMQMAGRSGADVPDPLVAGVMLQAALQQVGARCISASVPAPPQCDSPSLEMFARHCDLLLIIDQAPARRPADPGLATPPTFEVDGRICVVLPPCPLAALASFLTFVVPLIRRLQGRLQALPGLRSAVEDGTDLRLRGGQALVCVSATGHGDAVRVKPCAPPDSCAAQGIADVSGVAWRAEGLSDERGRLLCYLPLVEWLH